MGDQEESADCRRVDWPGRRLCETELCCILLALGLAAYGQASDQPTRLTVGVQDPSGAYIPGARVFLTEIPGSRQSGGAMSSASVAIEQLAARNGTAEFSVDRRKYQLTVSAQGFFTRRLLVDVVSNSVQQVVVKLQVAMVSGPIKVDVEPMRVPLIPGEPLTDLIPPLQGEFNLPARRWPRRESPFHRGLRLARKLSARCGRCGSSESDQRSAAVRGR